MSVYTSIKQQPLEDFLAGYSLGYLVSFSGIEAGIENTNYRIKTTEGEFILTIFESLTDKELPDFLNLLKQLSQKKLPVPQPQVNKKGDLLNQLKQKPAVIFNCLPGTSVENPDNKQCSEIGIYLAKLHFLTKNSDFYQQNVKNIKGCKSVYQAIKLYLSNDDIKLIDSELAFQTAYSLPDLPKGIIHADLFKDNVLFDQGKVSGIVDFYNACYDTFLFDIAVTCNDWCVEKAKINQQQFQALLSGYNSVRVMSEDEIKHLPIFLRLTALRFWLSRLEHQINTKEGELTLQKDPLEFRQLLQYHRKV